MPRHHAPKPQPAPDLAPSPHRMLTLDEVAERAQISRRTLFNLRRRGEGPEITYFGSQARVSPRAFDAWQQSQVKPDKVA